MGSGRPKRDPERVARRSLWTQQVLVWSWRVGRVLMVAAAFVIVTGGGQVVPEAPFRGGENRAAALVGERFETAAWAVDSDGGSVLVVTAGWGCFRVGLDSAGVPVWPAAPAACLEPARAAEAASRPTGSAEEDAAVGWATAVLSGGPAERYAAEGVATPVGPWSGEVERFSVDVSGLGDGGLWVEVSGWWDGRPFTVGWRVEVAPAGGEFEVVSVGPARSGDGAAPTSTVGDWSTGPSSTTTTTATVTGGTK